MLLDCKGDEGVKQSLEADAEGERESRENRALAFSIIDLYINAREIEVVHIRQQDYSIFFTRYYVLFYCQCDVFCSRKNTKKNERQ